VTARTKVEETPQNRAQCDLRHVEEHFDRLSAKPNLCEEHWERRNYGGAERTDHHNCGEVRDENYRSGDSDRCGTLNYARKEGKDRKCR